MAYSILIGDCRDVLMTIPDGSIRCCVCSPPYYGLRDYQTAEWEGGSPGCDHSGEPFRTKAKINANCGTGTDRKNAEDRQFFREACGKCGARRVDRQIGLEESPDAFVAALVGVFREVKRVLADDGTVWLNLGSSYAGADDAPRPAREEGGTRGTGSTPGPSSPGGSDTAPSGPACGDPRCPGHCGICWAHYTIPLLNFKAKDEMNIPHLVALALQADGWYLRSTIIWAKPNPMPESVRDRPTKSHEYVFMLSKQGRYYYDAEAVREEARYGFCPTVGDPRAGRKSASTNLWRSAGSAVEAVDRGRKTVIEGNGGSRNLRTVWNITPRAFRGAHFATFPVELAVRCIRAGTSERGKCPECGGPWVRVVERVDTGRTQKMADGWDTGPGGHGTIHRNGREAGERGVPILAPVTTGWRPTCECGHEPIPDVVLDPFAGAGTTLLAADRLGRDAVGIELNAEYRRMALGRIAGDEDIPLIEAAEAKARESRAPLPGQLTLFAGEAT